MRRYFRSAALLTALLLATVPVAADSILNGDIDGIELCPKEILRRLPCLSVSSTARSMGFRGMECSWPASITCCRFLSRNLTSWQLRAGCGSSAYRFALFGALSSRGH